jgi:plasmid segregation protein ParM
MENQKLTSSEIKTTGVRTTVLDWGNMAVKFVGVDSSGSFSARVSTEYQAYEEGFQRIQLDGKMYYFEIGELQKEFNKCEKDYIPQLLYSICRANNKEDIISTNLTLLLPTIQMQNKPKLVEKLKNTEWSFLYNGKERMVTIQDVLILPEGYISYFSLDETERKGSLAIIDIGSRTVNLAVMHNGKIEKLHTTKIGSYDFYSKIKNIENAKGNDLVEEDIQRLIDENIIRVNKYEYANFLNDIINSIKAYVNLKLYKVIFTGGTSLMLQEYIQQLKLPNYTILMDAANSNVQGALVASKMVWKDIA